MLAIPKRWFRFSLRTLFVVVTVAAAFLGWLMDHRQWIAERQLARYWLERRDGNVVYAGQPYTVQNEDELLLHTLDGVTWADGRPIDLPQAPWSLWILGEPSAYFVILCENPSRPPLNMAEVTAKLPELASLFPESEFLVITLPKPRDDGTPQARPPKFFARPN